MDTAYDDRYYLLEIEQALDAAPTPQALYQAIVNAPFIDRLRTTLYGLGIIVLLKVNQQMGSIDRIALSDTEPAKGAVRMSVKQFDEIRIRRTHPSNLIARAIRTGTPQHTSDWRYLFVPELTPQEARLNQAGAGIDCSFVYPIMSGDGAALIFSYFEPYEHIGVEQRDFMKAYARIVGRKLH